MTIPILKRFKLRFERVPEHLRGEVHDVAPDEPLEGDDLRMIFGESWRFGHSDEPGIQIADVLAAAFTRAMNQKLGVEG